MNSRTRVLIVISVLGGISLLTLLVAAIVTRTMPLATSESIAALAAWSTYAQAVATIVLVLLAGPTAYTALRDLRTRRRPVLSVASASFNVEGVQIRLQNVGETAWVNAEVRGWIVHLGPEMPGPVSWAEALERIALQIQGGLQPHFVGTFNALGVGQERWDLLRWGPRAGEYDPAWTGEFGLIVWDATVEDLYRRRYVGSGHTDIES
jgi:hypothetical protein